MRQAIVDAVTSYRYSVQNEMDFHRGLEAAFDAEGISYQHEHDLGKLGTIDFFCDGIGIEVKVDSSAPAVLRQLIRYAESDQIREMMLVTTKAKHRNMPSEVLDKPLTVVVISVGLS